MKIVTLSDILSVADCERDAVVSWERRGLLIHKFPPTTQGTRRVFHKANAREIGLMAAATAVGIDPSIASGLVARWLREAEAGMLKGWFIANPRRISEGEHLGWMEFGDTGAESSLSGLMGTLDDQSEGGFASEPIHSHKPATHLVAINVAEVIRRADALFA